MLLLPHTLHPSPLLLLLLPLLLPVPPSLALLPLPPSLQSLPSLAFLCHGNIGLLPVLHARGD
jgi:hypothetical protein